MNIRIAGLVLPMLAWAGALAAQKPGTAKAESFGVAVRTATVNQTSPAAVLPSEGGTVEAEAQSVSVPAYVTAADAFAVASGASARQDGNAVSSATLRNVIVLDGRIIADAVVAMASSTDGNSNTAGSSVANLIVDGVPIVDPAPNTRVDMPGAGYVVLNEQILANDGSITVNMIHVVLQSGGDIIVGSATSSVK